MNFRSLAHFVSALLSLGAANDVSAQVAPSPISITDAGFVYSQNFNTLSSAGTLNLPGWFASRPGFAVAASVPSSTGLYSYNLGSGNYALGSYVSQAGSSVYYGVSLTNNTGGTITGFSISLTSTGVGALGNNDTISPDYRFGSSGDFISLGSVLELGNSSTAWAPPNQTWGNGQTLTILWTDTYSSSGQQRARALDNLSFGALTVTPVPEPSTYAMLLGLSTLGLVWFRRCSARQ